MYPLSYPSGDAFLFWFIIVFYQILKQNAWGDHLPHGNTFRLIVSPALNGRYPCVVLLRTSARSVSMGQVLEEGILNVGVLQDGPVNGVVLFVFINDEIALILFDFFY